MVVLETNVVSELMRASPHPQVLRWVDREDARGLFVVSRSARRKSEPVLDCCPMDGIGANLATRPTASPGRAWFSGRVLPFDAAAARVYADIACQRRAAGRPISQFDCQIAAIARARSGMAVATRDVDGFRGCGIDVNDPWSDR